MAWSTTREDLIREFCPVVADDTTNWPAATLQARFNTAFYWLKGRLCPVFAAADIDLLNGAETHTAMGDRLIARVAAWMIYLDLPDTDETADGNRKQFIDEWIHGLKTGDDLLYNDSGAELARESSIYHTHEDVEQNFTMSKFDKNSGQQTYTGSLDAHS